MNRACPVETAEISDADLDNVSGGGLAVGGLGGLSVETPIADVCADLMAVASTEGLAAGGSVHTTAL